MRNSSLILKALSPAALAVALALPALSAQALPSDLSFTATGQLVSEPTVGCEATPEGCVYQVTGTIQGQGVGKGDYTLTILQPADDIVAADNGCRPTSGELLVTAANGDSITLYQTGQLCEVPTLAAPAPLLFDGAFSVLSGDGRLEGVTGTGRTTLSIDPNGNSLMHLHGVFQ